MATASHPEETAADNLGSVLDAVVDARLSDGYAAGYRRAMNDVLADFALLAAEVAVEAVTEGADIRIAFGRLQQRFEQHLDGRPCDGVAGASESNAYVDGGLGI